MFKRILTYSILTLIALGGFFGNIHTSQDIHIKGMISISFEWNTTYAAFTGPCPAGQTPGKDKCEGVPTPTDATKWANQVVDILNIILGFVTLVVSPAIMFAGWLMSPDWTSGDLFGLRTPMYALWVTVSNIVYFIYAVLLILIALGTMFGQDKFSYKVMLPKLALGILMVPFTWWFVQWTISIASVVTASVITIPMETIPKDGNSWMDKPSIPTKIVIDENQTDKNKKTVSDPCQENKELETPCMAPVVFLRKQSGMYGYMMVYAYSIFKFDQVKNLTFTVDQVKTVTGIIHQGLMGMLMFLVFGLLTLALVAMLLVRAIKLWVYAIFSPLFTFRFVAGSNIMGWAEDSFTIKEFIGLCFVPAIVGLTLSFGLILINAVSSDKGGGQKTPCNTIETGCSLVQIMGVPENEIIRKVVAVPGTNSGTTTNTIKWWGITIDFIGKAWASNTPASEAKTVEGINNVLNSTSWIFGTLIIDIISLVFIWMAFMAAKNVSKAVAMAVEPFEKIGKQVGSLASSIPKYTPIPGLGMSANSLSKVPDKIQAWFETRSNEKAADSALGKLIGLDGKLSKDYTALKQAKEKDRLTRLELDTLQQHVRNIVGTKWTISSEAQEAIKDFANIVKKSTDNISLKEKLDKDLLQGWKLTDAWSHLILGKLADSTHISDRELVNKLTKANSEYVASSTAWWEKTINIITDKKKLSEDGLHRLDILDQPIEFKLKNDGSITGDITGIANLKDKKSEMTKEDFIKALQKNGSLSNNAAKTIADKIPDDFYKKPGTSSEESTSH